MVRRTRQPSMFSRYVTDTNHSESQWPSATPLHQKVYGGLEDLKKTNNFITAAKLVVLANEKKKKKKKNIVLV